MQQLQFNRMFISLLQKEESLLKDLTEKNVYRQTDYLAFLVTLKQQGLQLKQLEIQFQNDYGTLNYLAGIVDTTTAPCRSRRAAPGAPGYYRLRLLPDLPDR